MDELTELQAYDLWRESVSHLPQVTSWDVWRASLAYRQLERPGSRTAYDRWLESHYDTHPTEFDCWIAAAWFSLVFTAP